MPPLHLKPASIQTRCATTIAGIGVTIVALFAAVNHAIAEGGLVCLAEFGTVVTGGDNPG